MVLNFSFVQSFLVFRFKTTIYMEMSIALNYDVSRYGLSYELYLCNQPSPLKDCQGVYRQDLKSVLTPNKNSPPNSEASNAYPLNFWTQFIIISFFCQSLLPPSSYLQKNRPIRSCPIRMCMFQSELSAINAMKTNIFFFFCN